MSDISKVPLDRVDGIQTKLSDKQDKLIAGANIIIGPDNTISSISGSGAPTLHWYTNNTGNIITITAVEQGSEVFVYKNGILLQPAEDYTISGTTLTLTTAVTASDKITLSVFAEGAASSLKANVNLDNITTIDQTFSAKLNAAGIVTIKETYSNGDDWYRIWSDGWVEQGGVSDYITMVQNYTMYLLVPYNNTNYTLVCQQERTIESHSNHPTIYSKSTDSFVWFLDYNTYNNWYACGYVS